ncbi:MAG TPA: DMT family transporter [Tabrizicola sp.]|nr:DMT family transporter [Tabrizicola sp.]
MSDVLSAPPPSPTRGEGSTFAGRRWFFVIVLILLGVSWGSTQALGKMATATGHEPLGLIVWQSLIAVAVLSALCLMRGKGLVLSRRTVPFYVVISLIGTVVPNVTFYTAVRELPAGIMSILISAVPLLAFPMALAMRQDRFSWVRVCGLMLGLLGVVMILGPDTGGDVALLWVMVALVGPLCYALEATFVAWKGTPGIDPIQAILGASVVSLVITTPLALATGQWVDPFPMARPEVALLILATLSAVVYAAYIWLAMAAGSVFTSQVSYIVTGSGVLWAMVLLGERFQPVVWLALVAMLAGVALVQPRAARAGEV